MLYRVTIDLAFPTEAPALALTQHALGVFPQAITINPGTPYQEKGIINRLDCHHDDIPPQACDLMEHHETP